MRRLDAMRWADVPPAACKLKFAIQLTRRSLQIRYALDSNCYHMGGNLATGDIEELPSGVCVVVCPYHHYKVSTNQPGPLCGAPAFTPVPRRGRACKTQLIVFLIPTPSPRPNRLRSRMARDTTAASTGR